jgi:Flp pilus assembly protein TadG
MIMLPRSDIQLGLVLKVSASIRRMMRAGVEPERGSSLVEFALVLPLLCLMLLGTIDLGRLAYVGIETASAARAGAQYGALNSTTSSDIVGMQNAAMADAADLPSSSGGGNNPPKESGSDGASSASGIAATATYWCQCSDGSQITSLCTSPPSCAGAHPVTYVQVSTQASYKPWFPYPGLPSTLNLSGKAVMRAGQ